MIIGDRPQTAYDLNFRLLGVPVRVNPWFWLIAVLLGPIQDEPKFMLTWVIVVFVSILVHEMGHALAIRGFGWWPSILLYSFGGLAMYQPTHHNPRKQIAVSLAGPAAGFLLAALTLLLLRATGNSIQFSLGPPMGLRWGFLVRNRSESTLSLITVFNQLLQVNIWWGLVNLLPIWPLDGGHVAYELLTDLRVPDPLAKSLMLSMMLSAVVAVYSFIRIGDPWLALMFGYLAYNSFSTLQSYTGRGGGYGGRW